MNMVDGVTLPWSYVEATTNTVNFQITINLTAFFEGRAVTCEILFYSALLKVVRIEGPVLLTVGLSHIRTGVTASLSSPVATLAGFQWSNISCGIFSFIVVFVECIQLSFLKWFAFNVKSPFENVMLNSKLLLS